MAYDKAARPEGGFKRRNPGRRRKILPRRITGNCAKHQRALTVAIKRARHVALMPYVQD